MIVAYVKRKGGRMPAIKVQIPIVIRQAIKIVQKPTNGYSWYLNCLCSCGCRLRTDNAQVWCSGVKCNYLVDKEKFLLEGVDKDSEFFMTWKEFTKHNKVHLEGGMI
jgi:hypothetical protein